MLSYDDLPAASRAWLADLDRRTTELPPPARAELLEGIAAHLRDALAVDPGGEVRILADLGSTDDVAAEAVGAAPASDSAPPQGWVFNGKRAVQILALVLAVAGLVTAGLLPLATSVTETSDGVREVTRETLLAQNGPGILAILAVPVILTLVPVLLRGRAWFRGSIVCGVLLALGIGPAMMSVGFFFVPALLAAGVGMILPPRRRDA